MVSLLDNHYIIENPNYERYKNILNRLPAGKLKRKVKKDFNKYFVLYNKFKKLERLIPSDMDKLSASEMEELCCQARVLSPKIVALNLEFLENLKDIKNLPVKSLCSPPGHSLVRLLQFVYTKRCYELYFVQTVADMRDEYFDALASNKKWTARWRRIQIYPSVGMIIVAWAGTSVVKKLSQIWKLL